MNRCTPLIENAVKILREKNCDSAEQGREFIQNILDQLVEISRQGKGKTSTPEYYMGRIDHAMNPYGFTGE